MTAAVSCPVCGGEAPAMIIVCDRNRRTSATTFTYRRCVSCEVIFLHPIPEHLAQYYPAGYVTPPATVTVLQRIAGQIGYQCDLLRRFVTDGRLLEIGPGYGSFLWLAKSAGFSVDAIDPDDRAAVYLRDTVGAQVFTSDAPQTVMSEMRDGQYDAVVLWHSLEHLPQPWDTLHEASRLLRAGGVIVIATPNPLAWQFVVLGRYWPHVDAPRHLWLLPLSAIARYLDPLGVRLVFSTTNDPGGQRWDRFGWSQTLMNVLPGVIRRTWPAKAVTHAAGHLMAFILRPWERATMRGAAYTAVFQKKGEA